MKITSQLTDAAILEELGSRLMSVRLERNLTQAALAKQAGVAKRTVERLESGEVATQFSGFLRVCRVLGFLERIDTFIPESVESPITQLKSRGQKRKRARGKKATARRKKKWTWGDRE